MDPFDSLLAWFKKFQANRGGGIRSRSAQSKERR
jgi:hypothetical protein